MTIRKHSNVQIVASQKPISDADLRQVELRLGIILPEEYRQYLMAHNGGRPTPADFCFKNERGPYTDSSVNLFFSIGDVPEYCSFEGAFANLNTAVPRLPHNIVALADDSGGNLICLSVTGADIGKVYFWNHEQETSPPTYISLHLIADSFSEFLNGLYEAPEYSESEMHRILRTSDVNALMDLLSSGWNVDSKDHLGLSMLETAAGRNQVGIANILLQHGAMIGRALDIAQRTNAVLHTHDAMTQLLEAHSQGQTLEGQL